MLELLHQLQLFNISVATVLPLIDPRLANVPSAPAYLPMKLRGLIWSSQKVCARECVRLWLWLWRWPYCPRDLHTCDGVGPRQETMLRSSLASTMHNKPGKVRVNRARALRARDVADGFGTGTLLEQVYQHYKNLPRSHLRCANRAFEVVFVGEGASDYGVRRRGGVVLRLVAPTKRSRSCVARVPTVNASRT